MYCNDFLQEYDRKLKVLKCSNSLDKLFIFSKQPRLKKELYFILLLSGLI